MEYRIVDYKADIATERIEEELNAQANQGGGFRFHSAVQRDGRLLLIFEKPDPE